MPIRNGEYVTRTEAEVFDTLAEEVLDEEPNANPRSDSTMVYATLLGVARTISQNQEVSLQTVYESAYIQDATDEELTKKAENLGVIRRDATKATGVVTFSRNSPPSQDTTIPAGTIVETVEIDPIQFETTEGVVMSSSETSVQANIQAIEGGSSGNVGPSSIESIPSPPIDMSVTNPDPTGDPSLTDTNGDPLIAGRDREQDDDLRRRVLDTDATNEGPSADGVELALADIKGVISSHMNTNQTSSTVNGIDPYHSEIVVYGGDTYDIAKTIYETMSATTVLRLQGGVNGTKNSSTIYSQLLDQDITIPITRPTTVTMDITIDVVHTAEYGGDIDVKDTVVEYIGGTRADDSTTTGIGVGDNVMVNEVENRVENVQGVDYADVTLIDTNSDGTDDTTTDSDGVPVLQISNSEVSRVDADNITVNTTAR